MYNLQMLFRMEEIKRNLDSTLHTVHRSLIHLSYRGAQIDQIEVISDQLLASSDLFVMRVVPWHVWLWRRLCICPTWWFQTNTEENVIRKRPWIIV